MTAFKGLLRSLVIVSALLGLTACVPEAPPADPPSEPWVKVLYLRPTDRSYRPDYSNAVSQAVDDVQAWMRSELGGRSFVRQSRVVPECALPGDSEYYRTDTWNRVLTDVQSCAPVSGFGSQVTWVLYVDVIDDCGPGRIGAAYQGLTMLPRADLEGLVGEPQVDRCGDVDNRPRSRWVGGLVHEMAHAFGVPHPPGCDAGLPTCDSNSIMWQGFYRFPNTYLSSSERQLLLESPFIR